MTGKIERMRSGTLAPAIDGLLGRLALGCRAVAVILLALIACLILAQVLGRNLFDLGMPWADELARFCGVALVFLGAPLLAHRGQHVAVDMILAALPNGPQRALGMLIELAFLGFASLALWGLYAFLGRAWKFATPTLGIPNWIFYAPAIIGFVLLAAIALSRCFALLRGETLSKHEAPQP